MTRPRGATKRRFMNAYDAYWFLYYHPKMSQRERSPLSLSEATQYRRKHYLVTRDAGGNYWREWRHLHTHAIETNLEIHYAKVDRPGGHGRIDQDTTKNIHVECWLECGAVEYGYCQPEFEAAVDHARSYAIHYHDIRLDSGGVTFDAALMMMARKALKYLGDYTHREYPEGPCGRSCGDCQSVKKLRVGLKGGR